MKACFGVSGTLVEGSRRKIFVTSKEENIWSKAGRVDVGGVRKGFIIDLNLGGVFQHFATRGSRLSRLAPV